VRFANGTVFSFALAAQTQHVRFPIHPAHLYSDRALV
jgi:hypothetical protein